MKNKAVLERSSCAQCGWPVRETGSQPLSTHVTSMGSLQYRRCLCGAWLVLLDGSVVGQTDVAKP
jgi:hypothetical protein